MVPLVGIRYALALSLLASAPGARAVAAVAPVLTLTHDSVLIVHGEPADLRTTTESLPARQRRRGRHLQKRGRRAARRSNLPASAGLVLAGLGVVSLALSIFSGATLAFFLVSAVAFPLAIVFGARGLRRARRGDGEGRGLAWAGLVGGIAGVAFLAFLVALVLELR